jgi:adenylylsulfate kinase-like enzyme
MPKAKPRRTTVTITIAGVPKTGKTAIADVIMRALEHLDLDVALTDDGPYRSQLDSEEIVKSLFTYGVGNVIAVQTERLRQQRG